MTNPMTTTPTPPEPARTPVIDGLPAIEYIETTDVITGTRYTVRFMDGREIDFTITRADMIEYSRSYPGTNAARSLITKRARQAYDVKYPQPATGSDGD